MKHVSRLFLLLLLMVTQVKAQQGETLTEDTDSNDSCACCTEAHRAFDFWVGEWEVRDTAGNLLGTNRIEKLHGGCLLHENWEGSRPGSTGSSFNFYNPGEDRWEQIWVDPSGTILKLYGGRKGNQMILKSEPFEDADGNLGQHRISWTLHSDGSVRQLWEVVRGDEVLRVLFEGRYQTRP